MGRAFPLFHASWRQQTGLPVYERPDDDANCREWNFATLTGRGIYKGDVLTLYNHSRAWYGEGDEKIWVDDDVFHRISVPEQKITTIVRGLRS